MIKVKNIQQNIRLVLEEIPYVKSVSIGIWVKAGAVNESSEIAGISHFIEHMMFKGTNKRTAKEIASDTDRIAGQSNAFTGKEATCYYIKTMGDNIEEGIDIIADMFMHSVFDKTEMDKERQVIFEEMKMIEDSPEDDVHDIITECVFQGEPLANSIIGTRDTLTGIDTQKIREYLDENYTQDNVVVAIAGSFDEEQVQAIFEKKLSGLRKESQRSYDKPAIYVPSFRSKVKEIEQSHLCMAMPTNIYRNHKDYAALKILSSIIGGTMSSRLFQNIREEKGLAYSVYSLTSSYVTNGYFNIYAGVGHDRIADAIEGIKEELALIRTEGVTSDELDIARTQLLGGYIYSMEHTNSRMLAIGKDMLLDGAVRSQEEIVEELKKVTMEDINRVAEMITDMNRFSGAVISDHPVDIEKIIRG